MLTHLEHLFLSFDPSLFSEQHKFSLFLCVFDKLCKSISDVSFQLVFIYVVQ